MDAEVLKATPDIIRAASGTPLGILALLILVVGGLGFYFFRNRGAAIQLTAFGLVFLAMVGFGGIAMSIQRAQLLQKDASDSIPDMTLRLTFPDNNAANPQHARATAWVLRKTTGKKEQLLDIGHAGPGGMYLNLNRLGVGDIISVQVEDRGKKWQSYDMQMLEANLQMNPEEQ